MTKLTDVLKREHEAAEKCHICLKEFNDPKKKMYGIIATTPVYIEKQS